MSERPTPETDLLERNPLDSNDVRAWRSLSARIERQRDGLAEALRYLATAGDEYDIALDRAWDILARLDAEKQA